MDGFAFSAKKSQMYTTVLKFCVTNNLKELKCPVCACISIALKTLLMSSLSLERSSVKSNEGWLTGNY